MGYSNVAAVYLTWPHLNHRAHRLLAFMALTALDGPSPRYWAGRCRQATALGYTGCTATPDCPQRTNHRRTAEVVAELVKAGAVTRLSSGARGRQAELVLHLLPAVDNPGGVAAAGPVRGLSRAP